MTSTTIPLISGKQHPEWRPAGPNDVRSPCPALNAMANHSIISHDGRNLTSAMLQTALKETYNTNPLMSRLAIIGGTLAPHLFFRSTFNLDDLQRQKMFKHDGLFGRPDFNTGEDVNEFSAATWESVMAHFHGQPETSFDTVAEARYGRIKEAIERHPKTVKYGSICYVLSYGEIAALLAVFADRETGSASVEYLNIFFAEERLPYAEGWRPHETPVSVSQVLRNMMTLVRDTGEDDTRPTLIKWMGIGGGRAKTT